MPEKATDLERLERLERQLQQVEKLAHEAQRTADAAHGRFPRNKKVDNREGHLHHHAYGDAPDSPDFLVGTATGELGNEIPVGTTPQGELGNTWASPTVDATHSGSAHADHLLASGARAGSTGQAQDFGSNGIKTDVLAESTGSAGVTMADCKALLDDFYLGAAADSSDVKLRNVSGILTVTRGDDSAGGVSTDTFVTANYMEALYYRLTAASPAELTLNADGEVTQTHGAHKLQPNTGITGALEGIKPVHNGKCLPLYLRVSDAADTITIKHDGTPTAGEVKPIECAGGVDIVLSGDQDMAVLFYDPVAAKWYAIGPSTTEAGVLTAAEHTAIGDSAPHHPEIHPHASHTNVGPDDHHSQSHSVASHSDTSATGPQLNTVTDGSEVDTLHTHRLTTYITIGSETGDGISYTV